MALRVEHIFRRRLLTAGLEKGVLQDLDDVVCRAWQHTWLLLEGLCARDLQTEDAWTVRRPDLAMRLTSSVGRLRSCELLTEQLDENLVVNLFIRRKLVCLRSSLTVRSGR